MLQQTLVGYSATQKKNNKVHECREVRAVRGCGVVAARHSCCSAAVLGGHTAADTRHQGAASGYLIVVEGASKADGGMWWQNFLNTMLAYSTIKL